MSEFYKLKETLEQTSSRLQEMLDQADAELKQILEDETPNLKLMLDQADAELTALLNS